MTYAKFGCRARYYDPSTGRFLSEDPIGFKSKDANYFRYLFSNPIMGTDPTGLESVQEAILRGEEAALTLQISKLKEELATCLSPGRKKEIEESIAKFEKLLAYKQQLRSWVATELNRICAAGSGGGRSGVGAVTTICEKLNGATALANAKSFLDDGD